MLKMHCPIATNGTKFVYRDDSTGEYVLATYSLNMRIPEIYLFPCTGTGKITDFGELYGESGSHLTPRDIHKVVYRYNNGGKEKYKFVNPFDVISFIPNS